MTTIWKKSERGRTMSIAIMRKALTGVSGVPVTAYD